jgi:hypothetical protein
MPSRRRPGFFSRDLTPATAIAQFVSDMALPRRTLNIAVFRHLHTLSSLHVNLSEHENLPATVRRFMSNGMEEDCGNI